MTRKNKQPRKIEGHKTIVDLFDGELPEAADFRRLFMRIQGSRNPGTGGNHRSFLITSAARGEGKTIVACCLAVTFARFNPRMTLLLDGDMRKPKVHEFFGLGRKPGLSDLLAAMKKQEVDNSSDSGLPPAGQSMNSVSTELLADGPGLEGYLRDSGLDNLKILTSGSSQVNFSEVIEKKKIRTLLSALGRSFNTIIIDSPPVVPVVDPLILGTEADATLLVVMAGQTPREVVLRAKDILANAQVNLIGVVANDVKSALPYYYDYKYYKHYYGERRGRR